LCGFANLYLRSGCKFAIHSTGIEINIKKFWYEATDTGSNCRGFVFSGLTYASEQVSAQ